MSNKVKGVLKNAFIVAVLTLLSRVLGLVREMLQSRLIGAGVEQSAFTLAFAIPNMMRKLFGEGALTSAFVPIFKSTVEEDGLEAANKLSRAVMTMVLLLLGAIISFSLAGTLTALRFANSYRAKLILELVAILLPYMLAICGAAFGMGVLNALGRFKASGFMPAFLNIVWIFSLFVLLFFPGVSLASRIRFVSAMILLGGFLQMAFMFYCMRRAGVAILPSFSWWKTEKVRLVWRNLGLAAIGTGAVQANYMLDQVLGQMASPWAAGVIGYAERLMDLPLGIIGVAFGTVLLPAFSGFFAHDDLDGAKTVFVSSLRNQILVMLPASVGICVLAPEIVNVIYEGGSFDSISTLRVSRGLFVYSAGLCFFSIHKMLVPWFHAQKNMKTPLRVALLTVCSNAALNIAAVFLLPEEFRHVGLAASTVFCSFLGCACLWCKAVSLTGSFGFFKIRNDIFKMVFCAVVMGLAVHFAGKALETDQELLNLSMLVSLGAFVYGVLIFSFKLASLKSILHKK